MVNKKKCDGCFWYINEKCKKPNVKCSQSEVKTTYENILEVEAELKFCKNCIYYQRPTDEQWETIRKTMWIFEWWCVKHDEVMHHEDSCKDFKHFKYEGEMET